MFIQSLVHLQLVCRPALRLAAGSLFLATFAYSAMNPPSPSSQPIPQPPPAPATATFGGGCFWCIEAVFQQLRGVQTVVSGYAGGRTESPDYEEVCAGGTGHAEVVQIVFDPAVISFGDLLDVFWEAHDPTTLNRQGADVGTQYRSVIFYHDPAQKAAAEASRQRAQAGRTSPIVTEISPFGKFFTAEEYHQNYFARNTGAPYCRMVIGPKLKKLEKIVAEKNNR